jgi:cell wall-associated NlpC family hydrolase
VSGRLSTYLFLAGAICLLLALPGCGESSNTPSTVAPAAAEAGGGSEAASGSEAGSGQTVSTVAISKYKPGTPEHTALSWWRAVQTNNPNAAISLYAEPPTLPNLAGQFNLVGEALAGTVKVASTKKKGTTATVNVIWSQPGGKTQPESLNEEELAGEWKIADTEFLDRMVQEIQAEEEGG